MPQTYTVEMEELDPDQPCDGCGCDEIPFKPEPRMQVMQRFTARQYLQIDIANSFGLDKLDWDDRLAWFQKNQDHLLDLMPQADEPALYYAGVKAWEAVQRGEAIGYPISLDATSSGLQLLAVLTGDRSAAEICNVVDTGGRKDAYTVIYQIMLQKLGGVAKIKREDTKHAIMTALYGSTAIPKEVFGQGDQLACFESTMEEKAPGSWELNKAFLDMWDPTALLNEWMLPDNFHVRVKVMSSITERVQFLDEPFEITRKVNAPTERGRSLGANTIHSIDGMIVREMARRCMYDPAQIQKVQDILHGEHWERTWTEESRANAAKMVKILWSHYQESGYLSARILDYVDSTNLGDMGHAIQDLIDSLPAKPFTLIAVHDCFRCLPQYANDLRYQYNLQLHLIAKSNLLGFLLSQILGRPIQVGKLDPSLSNDILNTNYALS